MGWYFKIKKICSECKKEYDSDISTLNFYSNKDNLCPDCRRLKKKYNENIK